MALRNRLRTVITVAVVMAAFGGPLAVGQAASASALAAPSAAIGARAIHPHSPCPGGNIYCDKK
jgi:hypothetical protein